MYFLTARTDKTVNKYFFNVYIIFKKKKSYISKHRTRDLRILIMVIVLLCLFVCKSMLSFFTSINMSSSGPYSFPIHILGA